jgi:signal transduction histidine kinase
MVLALTITGMGIIYMLHRDPLNMYYYGGLFLVFMGGYFYIRLRFMLASISGLLLVVLYNITFFIIPNTSNSSVINLITANAFFIASNVICMIGLYGSERQERLSFYRNHIINIKQTEIEKINNSLEEKVLTRTHELNLAKNKADESNKLKSAFLANMSHEIRTPMNGILGFTSLLNNPDLNKEDYKNYVSIINKSGNRMLDTVNSIIEISKIDAEQIDVIIGTINIVQEINSLYEFFIPQTKTKNLDYTLKLTINDNETLIKTDINKFQSILTNLIKNAIKYTDKGFISINACFENNYLTVSVIDSGIGIPENRQAAIFNRFSNYDE